MTTYNEVLTSAREVLAGACSVCPVCDGIVVSSHGGRVMEDAPAPASMLREIRRAVGASLKIFVDGGVRTGASGQPSPLTKPVKSSKISVNQ